MIPKRTAKLFFLIITLFAVGLGIFFIFSDRINASKLSKDNYNQENQLDLEVGPENEVMLRKQSEKSRRRSAIPNISERLLEGGKCLPSNSRSIFLKYYESSNNWTIPMFVNENYTTWKDIFLYPQPFGFKDIGKFVSKLLNVLPNSEKPRILQSKRCKRCIVVGSGDISRGKKLGKIIDSYDLVMRLNYGPTIGFEEDIGRKTDIRMVYPESAPQVASTYDPNALLLIATYKPLDLEWLRAVVTHSKVTSGEFLKGFWKNVTESVPVPSGNMRILNPVLVQTLSFEIIGNKENGGKVSHNVPTAGTTALFMLLNQPGCDQVDTIGFGYTKTNPQQKIHYYDKREMSNVIQSRSHNITSEKAFLQDLVQHGIIQDLTGGINWV